MTINPGARLGAYEVLSLLGAGGMGQVYRARDTRLAREVAIKMLLEAYAADASRLRRFETEARAVSALNHPNILTIYDIGTAEGAPYLVTELLEGQTLRQRMSDAALPAWRIVDYALQIANGLAAAHEKRIVHRDLKPENVFITKDERIKILDFGLAKLAPPEVGATGAMQSPEVIGRTRTGMVMGTVGYMSPEQVRGAEVDHRSDIFAFGAILYEMIAGRQAFCGASSVETMSAILREEPADLSELTASKGRRAVSLSMERIVRHCLEKGPEARFQAARDLVFALQEVLSSATPAVRSAPETVLRSAIDGGPGVRRAKAARLWAIATASVLVVALLVGLGTGGLVNRREPLILGEATTEQITFNPADEPIFLAAISPDNKWLAYADLGGVHLRQTDTGETHLLPVPEGFCFRCPNLTWFHNSTKLLASGPAGPEQANSIWSISIVGGELRKLRDNASHASPSPDGSLVAFITANNREIWLMNANGDEPRKLLGLGRDATFFQVGWSPDGRRVAYLKIDSATDEHVIEAYVMTTGRTDVLWSDKRLRNFVWTSRGRIIGAMGTPYSNAFNPAQTDLWAIDVQDGVPSAPTQLANFAGFQASSLSVTADGNHLALVRKYDQSDVYVGELAENATRFSNPPDRLTRDDRIDWPGGWTRDGKAILFYSDRQGPLDLFKQDVDGIPEVLLQGSGEKRHPQLSPDGASILYLAWPALPGGTMATAGKVMRIPVAGGPPQVTLDATGYPGSIRELRALDELDSGVLTTSGQPDFRCARQAGSFCVLSESDSSQVAFSTFDPVSGRIAVAATIDVQGTVSWDLSPDGSRIAIAEAGLNDRIRILPATARSESSELSITGFRAVVSVGWAADGASLFVTGTAPEGGAIIRHVFFEGRSDLLYKVDGSLERPIQSPDGRYLSFGQATSNSNVWTIQNFEQD
jgi:Tol biopolymer transport system component